MSNLWDALHFMRSVQEKVVEYFTQNLPLLVTKANSLANREEYEQALAVLAVVPESAAEYPDIARLISEIYAKKMNRDGEQKTLEGMSKKSIEAAARKEGMEHVYSNLEGTHRI